MSELHSYGGTDSFHRLGWNEHLAGAFDSLRATHSDLRPGRIARVDRGSVLVIVGGDVLRATPSTALARTDDLPAVGDWVGVRQPGGHDAIVEAILPRSSGFRRAESDGAVLAANVDVMLLVHAGPQANERRIERELTQVLAGGATPVIVLTKRDLVAETSTVATAVADVALGTPVHLLDARFDAVDALLEYARPNRTLALIGPSGVGKSTLANRLLGEDALATGAVRESDGKGRHTTTARHLFELPNGGVLIDTPGMRSLGLTEASEGLSRAFEEIEALATCCRFRDCEHRSEPGCAVLAAVQRGDLGQERLDSYRRLSRESEHYRLREDALARTQERDSIKRINRDLRRRKRARAFDD